MSPFLFIQKLVSSILLIGLVVTCRSKSQDVIPSLDDNPQLLGVTIPGFPAENIAIDQGNKQILLTLPASATAYSFEAKSFQTSPGSSIWPEKEGYYPINLCQMPLRPSQPEGVYVLSATKSLSIYKFIIKPADNLKIGFIDNQTSAVIAQPLYFQIDNFLDGTGTGQIILTRTGTTERDTLGVYCYSQSVENRFMVDIPTHVRPGEYTVEIRKANGRWAIAKQKLQFKKGAPLFETSQFDYSFVAKSANLIIRGENLFADDDTEIMFRRLTGESFRVKPTAISPYGRALTINLPNNMPPGYYDAQILLRGQAVGSNYRFVVLQQAEQPSIININRALVPQSNSPLVLQRMIGHSARIQPEYGPMSSPPKLEIKLTSINDPKHIILFTFRTGNYNSDYPDPLTIPSTVPVGTYSLSVLATYPNGLILESEPLERPVVIQ